ncbi:MAG: cellulose biosynthesis cyclic di-GMP-binding regulatory protein BcsB [Candidatus Brocadiaceae bacterium]|nr:cellulose biosynthesis cyclic di-GMP-binding regulatory protein BcsB [Candidatus Brocadiaceae bacterium]
MKCISSEYAIPLSVPERWDIDKVVLSFKYVNSSSLLSDKSTLVLKINDYPVAQIKLSPVVTEGEVKVDIPPFLLDTGYNTLTFAVSQHYMDECEDPCAPDLWTIISLNESVLYVEYRCKPVPKRLSAIPEFLFDPKIFPYGQVNFIAESLISEELVNYAGIVASGIALRYDYRKVLFTLSKEVKPDVDNILLGKREFVEAFLKKEGIEINDATGALLKITHLPLEKSVHDSTHALIIITGNNLDQVKLAAETFAIMSFPYPDSDELSPLEFKAPDVSPYGGRLILAPDKKYTFRELNLSTHTFKGITSNPAELTFRLPPDFLVKHNNYANLSLHFAYGAGMRTISSLNILLNGKHIRAIRLDNEYGNSVEGYNISVPTHLFNAGSNLISFEPVLVPNMSSNCEPVPNDTLFFTLFDNSTFVFPQMPHMIELPELELFFLNGFPFTRRPDGDEMMMYITQPSSQTIASAFNIIGSITQKNGYPLLGMSMSMHKPEKWDGELIVLGSIDTIPDDLKELTPLKLTKNTVIPYPIFRSWKGDKTLAYSGQVCNFSTEKGAVMEFKSPYKAGRTILLLTAFSPELLHTLSKALLAPSVAGVCAGDLALVDLASDPVYKVYTFAIGEKYYSGKGGKISWIKAYLYSISNYYFPVLIFLLALLGVSVFYLLNRFRKRRLKNT